MIHFTYTGFNAGKAICGALRNQEDSYRHIPAQAEVKHIINMHGKGAICPECLLMWSMSYTTDDSYSAPDEPGIEWCPTTEQWVKDLALELHTKQKESEHVAA